MLVSIAIYGKRSNEKSRNFPKFGLLGGKGVKHDVFT